MPVPENAESVAVAACLAGGRYLRGAFAEGDTDAEHSAVDVKSSADIASERRMLAVLRAAFPEHVVDAEESGRHAGDDDRHRWIVDPLDGTNNFEAGMPSFATAVALLVDGRTELAVAHVPVTDELYVGTREELRYDGETVDGAETPPPDTGSATVMTVIGHDVKRDPDATAVSRRIDRGVEDRCKRRLASWSPTVHWGLLARGRIDGAVCYRPDAEEQRLGELFVEAVEMPSGTGEEWFVAGRTETLRDRLVGIVEDAI